MYTIQIIRSVNCDLSKKLGIFLHYSISMAEHVCPAHGTHFGKLGIHVINILFPPQRKHYAPIKETDQLMLSKYAV